MAIIVLVHSWATVGAVGSNRWKREPWMIHRLFNLSTDIAIRKVPHRLRRMWQLGPQRRYKDSASSGCTPTRDRR